MSFKPLPGTVWEEVDGEKCAIEYYLQDASHTIDFLEKDVHFSRSLEQKRIKKLARRKSDSRRRDSIAEVIGKCRTPGLLYECGEYLELWLSPEQVDMGNYTGSGIASPRKANREESHEQIARRVNHRARKQIRRIVNANGFNCMLTLTMALPHKDNQRYWDCVAGEKQRDYDFVRKMFSDFVKRFRKRTGWNLCYLVVFELHNSEKTQECKRNTWHVHLATHVRSGLEYEISKSWKHGIVDLRDFRFTPEGKPRDDVVENPGAYMAEYIGKDGEQFGERELIGKRRYTVSRDAKRPKKEQMGSVGIEGDFDRIVYRGDKYENVFYVSRQIPGTRKLSVTATYRRVRQK